MDFQDFPMILGNLGVETDHPPKMCAGLVLTFSFVDTGQNVLGCDAMYLPETLFLRTVRCLDASKARKRPRCRR